MLTVVSIRASITFAAGQSSEIGRYEVAREESSPGLGIGMTIDDFQIAGIRAAWVKRGGRVDERFGFGLYQYCENRGSVGRVSVFGLRW